MSENKKLEQNKQTDSTSSLLGRSLLTGFIGGVFWSTVSIILYYFNFMEVSPTSFILRSWLRRDWTDGWLGDLMSVLLIGLLSLVTALVYYGLLKKVKTMWISVVYGIALWAIVFWLLQPIFPNVPAFLDLQTDTIITSICLYILYGTFIGYSISYDYHDSQVQEL